MFHRGRDRFNHRASGGQAFLGDGRRESRWHWTRRTRQSQRAVEPWQRLLGSQMAPLTPAACRGCRHVLRRRALAARRAALGANSPGRAARSLCFDAQGDLPPTVRLRPLIRAHTREIAAQNQVGSVNRMRSLLEPRISHPSCACLCLDARNGLKYPTPLSISPHPFHRAYGRTLTP